MLLYSIISNIVITGRAIIPLELSSVSMINFLGMRNSSILKIEIKNPA